MASRPYPPLGVTDAPIDVQGDQDTIVDRISRMTAGNSQLVTHPHLLSAMLAGNATPQEAQTIDMFIRGMSAYQQLQTAQQRGVQVPLDPTTSRALTTMGINPGPAAITPQQQQQDFQSQLTQLRAQANGTADQGGGGGWSLGRVWNDITHNPVTDALGTAWNKGVETVGLPGQLINRYVPQANFLGMNWGGNPEAIKEQMRAAGYDPNNPMSVMAWEYSGHATIAPGGGLYDGTNNAQVDDAIRYAQDPQAYEQAFLNRTDLTPEMVQAFVDKMQNGSDFQKLVTKINANTVGFGNNLASMLHIDPVQHPTLYGTVADGTDIGMSFLADPFLVAGKVIKGVRATQIMVDGIGDQNKILRVFTDNKDVTLPDGATVGRQRGLWADRVRYGMQNFINNVADLRLARDGKAADGTKLTADERTQAMSQAYARIRSTTPGLQHLVRDFIGEGQVIDRDVEGHLIFGQGTPITNMAEAGAYLSSRDGLFRLFNGRPAAEVNLIPGSLSRYGFLRLRGMVADTSAAVFAGRAAKLYGKLGTAIDLTEEAPRIVAKDVDKVVTATGRVVRDLGSGAVEVTDATGKTTRYAAKDLGDGTVQLQSLSAPAARGATDPVSTVLQVARERGGVSIPLLVTRLKLMTSQEARDAIRQAVDSGQLTEPAAAAATAKIPATAAEDLRAGFDRLIERGKVDPVDLRLEAGIKSGPAADYVVREMRAQGIIDSKGIITQKGADLRASGRALYPTPAPIIDRTDELDMERSRPGAPRYKEARYGLVGDRAIEPRASQFRDVMTVNKSEIVPYDLSLTSGSEIDPLLHEAATFVSLQKTITVARLAAVLKISKGRAEDLLATLEDLHIIGSPEARWLATTGGKSRFVSKLEGKAAAEDLGTAEGRRNFLRLHAAANPVVSAARGEHAEQMVHQVMIKPGELADKLKPLMPPPPAAKALPSAGRAAARGSGVAASAAQKGDVLFQHYGGVLAADRPGGRRTVQQVLNGWFHPLYVARRVARQAHRWSTYLPKSTVFRTSDPDGAEKIFQYAGMYLTKGDQNMMAAAYAAGDDATRKAILTGMQLQVMHAAGIGTDELSRDFLNESSRALLDEKYGITTAPFVDLNTGLTRDAALWPSDVNETLTLRSFRELQILAAKTGLWESTIGRGLNHMVTQALLGIVRITWLTTFSNVLRNAGEDLVHAWARGKYGDVSRAKIAGKDLIPARTRGVNWFVQHTPLARVGRAYAWALRRTATSEELRGMSYIARLDPKLLHEFGEQYMMLHLNSMVDPWGSADAKDIIQNGFDIAPVQFRKGFGKVSTHDSVGADKYAAALSRVFDRNTDLGQTILRHVLGRKGSSKQAIVDLLGKDRRVSAMIRAGQYRTSSGALLKVHDDASRALALDQLADDQIKEITYLVSHHARSLVDEAGTPRAQVNQKLAKFLLDNNFSPDADWIHANIIDKMRPDEVLTPLYAEKPANWDGSLRGFVGGVSDISGKGYKFLVERPIARMSTLPIFLSEYGNMRIFLEEWEMSLRKSGLSPGVADARAQEAAMDMAWRRTTQYIDDPTTRNGLDVTGRAFFSFSRATQAFIRRWAHSIYEDPTRLEKLMLAHEAAIKTGLIYTDDNGEEQFVFPGSGPMINALMGFANAFPGIDFVKLPGIVPGLHGKVQYLSPGLQNPLQMSMTPIINIPMRAIFAHFPQHRQVWDWLDAHLNGPTAASESQLGVVGQLQSEFEPTAFKKFSQAWDTDTRNSMLADAMRSTIASFAAAGKLPGQNPDATVTAADKQRFLTDVQGTVKGQLFLKAVFSLFSPAPPSTPDEMNAAMRPDWYYASRGAQNLTDEYRIILNDVHGDIGRASVIWSIMHPGKSFITTPTSATTARGGYVNPTDSSLKWVTDNASFMQQYGGVAAYFVPKDLQNGKFSLEAYNAEFELGLRQRKSYDEYYDDVANANAADLFFKSLDARDASIAADPANKSQIMNGWQAYEQQFYAQHPLFQQSQTDFAQRTLNAKDQLNQLRNMLAKPATVPANVPLPQVQQMVDAYDTYHSTWEQYQGNSGAAINARADLSGAYNEYMLAMARSNPQLQGLYVGVFRAIDGKVLDPLGSSS